MSQGHEHTALIQTRQSEKLGLRRFALDTAYMLWRKGERGFSLSAIKSPNLEIEIGLLYQLLEIAVMLP